MSGEVPATTVDARPETELIRRTCDRPSHPHPSHEQALRRGTACPGEHRTLDVQSGEALAVLGKSGSGKSTLLNLIAGLDRPTEGTVSGRRSGVDKMNETELAKYRREQIGIVFQFFNLLDDLTVGGQRAAAGPTGRDGHSARPGARAGAAGAPRRRPSRRWVPRSAVAAVSDSASPSPAR